MNIAKSERSERVFSSTGQEGLTSDNAKFFAYPVQSGHTSQSVFGRVPRSVMAADACVDFRRFAFKALPVCGADGLKLSAHLAEQDALFGQAWAIYAEAFAGSERRSRREQSRVMRDSRYRFSAVMQEGLVVGVLAWWELSGFCFVEHFAISSAQRSGGFGRRALELLQAHVASPIVVDVAPFGTDLQAARRVAFYSRLGFTYSGQSVTLPAYEGKALEPSNLMAWPVALGHAGREQVLETIGHEIYSRARAVSYPSAV